MHRKLYYVCYFIVDIDECRSQNGGCQHTCINLRGTYKCQCPAGQRLQPDGRTCTG